MSVSIRLAHTRSALARVLKGTKNYPARAKFREFVERRAGAGDTAAQIHVGMMMLVPSKRFSEADRAEILRGLERDLPSTATIVVESGESAGFFEVMSSAPRSDCWAQLARGGSAQIDCPDPRDIRIEDIAHALARLCRFGGHVKPEVEIYSVAQHSLLVSEMCPPQWRLIGLLHDAAEAYVGDVIRPVKMLLPSYKLLERRWEIAIGEAFGLGQLIAVLPESVKFADNRALATEKRDVLSCCPRAWVELPPPNPETIIPMGVRAAETAFLARFERLVSEVIAASGAERTVYQVPTFEGRVHNTPYMLEVKRLPCAGPRPHKCERDEDGMVQAAHTGRRGLGTKASDETTIPLCAQAHRDSDDFSGAFQGLDRESRRAFFDAEVVRTQAKVLPLLNGRRGS